eukprot:Lankesteria_metandrocarpae@DN4977_c0_g1_i1.p1
MHKPNDAQAQKLLPKECQQFKVMMRLHDNKQYRKALKAADGILKKSSTHGETLAMKGLILANLPDRKSEAYECAKKGLKLDIASSMCWHVVGILYRQDRDYGEAVRFFKRASALNKTHLGIMRDLAILLLHQRELDKHLAVRRQILDIRSKTKSHWVTFAMAYHLAGNFEASLALLNFVETNFDHPDPQEHSEFILYKAMVMEELGKYKDCSDYLSRMRPNLTDLTAALQIIGRVLVLQRDFIAASVAYGDLLRAFPNNEDWAIVCFVLHPKIQKYFLWPTTATTASASVSTLVDDSTVAATAASAIPCASIQRSRLPVAELSPQLVKPHGTRRRAWLMDPQHTWRFDDSTLLHTSSTSRESGGSTGAARLSGCLSPAAAYIATHMFGGAFRPLGASAKMDTVVWSSNGKSVAGYCLDLEPEDEREFTVVCNELQEQYPQSSTLKCLPLFFAKDTNLLACVDDVLLPLIWKFAPSAFEVLRPAYCSRNADKIYKRLKSYEGILTADTVETRRVSLEDAARAALHTETCTPAQCDAQMKTKVEQLERALFNNPTCLPALYVLLAQHFDTMQDFVRAEEYVDRAQEHTPTAVEIELIKGTILKRAGRYKSASAALEGARHLDLADRFVNVKATESLIRLGQVHKAEDISRAFTRQSDSGGALDMQCMWFELAKGRAWLRLRNYGMSLKQFKHVITYYASFRDEQFDFHQYCLRRQTYRTTVEFLRMQDHLERHRFCRTATYCGVEVALKMIYRELFKHRCTFDEPQVDPLPCVPEEGADDSTAADGAPPTTPTTGSASKTPSAVRTATSDTPATDESNTTKQQRNRSKGSKDTKTAKGTSPAAKDDDDDECKASLQDTHNWIDALRSHCRMDPRTHASAYDVYSHSKGSLHHLVMLQALSRLWRVSSCQTLSPILAPRLAHFLRFLLEETIDQPQDAAVIAQANNSSSANN